MSNLFSQEESYEDPAVSRVAYRPPSEPIFLIMSAQLAHVCSVGQTLTGKNLLSEASPILLVRPLKILLRS